MTVDRLRLRVIVPATGLVVLAIVAVAMILAAPQRPVATLDGLSPLIAARRWDDAERRLADYLRAHPRDVRANLLMAQVALARDVPKPERALHHLDRIDGGDVRIRTTVLLHRGKALSELGRNDEAEAAWKGALRLDPTAPEVGWNLLGLYYVQGRRNEAHRLAMELHAVEPDPRDRVQLLLELVRQDAKPIGPDSLIRTLEPIVRARPADRHTAIALGLALVRNSRADEGLAILRGLVDRHPEDEDARLGLLLGLDEARRPADLVEVLAGLPRALADDSRFQRYRAAVAQERGDWGAAATGYLRAWQADPSDFQVLYRLSRALRAAGRSEEAGRFDAAVRGAQRAREDVLALYEEANAVKDLGTAPHPELYRRLADLRERTGRPDEALAWHRLALRDRPDDPISRAAVARLDPARGQGGDGTESGHPRSPDGG
jgi:tetratricopeptide (TPR) repeat protein